MLCPVQMWPWRGRWKETFSLQTWVMAFLSGLACLMAVSGQFVYLSGLFEYLA